MLGEYGATSASLLFTISYPQAIQNDTKLDNILQAFIKFKKYFI